MAWERIQDTPFEMLRFPVPGGWLYRVGTSTVFVPEPNKVSPQHDNEPEHDDFGFEDKPEVDENSPAYARGMAIGFDMARKQFVGSKVTLDQGDEQELIRRSSDNLGFIGRKKPSNEPKVTPITWDAALYGEIEALLPKDGVIDDSCSLVNEIISLIQKREIG